MNEMGENIKFLRRERGWTQAELGSKLVPKVNKTAILKWEKGEVENIKRTHIAQMATLFDVRPSELMGFYDDDNAEIKFRTMAGHRLMNYLNSLNNEGQQQALTQIELLTQIDKYRK